MGENGTERLLGTIIAKLDAADQKHKDFREDIKQLYGETGKNSNDVGTAHTRIDDMKDDIQTIQKKSMLAGGGSGIGSSAIMMALKEFFMGNG